MAERPSRHLDGQLRDAVREHAPSLYRSAVMLTGRGQSAHRLLVGTFQHLLDTSPPTAEDVHPTGVGSWRGDHLLAEVVREFLREAPRGRVDRVESARQPGDAGDLLPSLRPQQRAAAVLGLVEGWTPERTARTLGVRQGRLPALLPSTEGLVTALEAVADQDSTPPEDVVVAVLSGLAVPTGTVTRRVAVPSDSGGDRRSPSAGSRPTPSATRNTRRPWRWLGAAVVVALGGAVTAALSGDEGTEGDRLVADRSGWAAPVSDLSDRGWVLDADGKPPSAHEGLLLLGAHTIDYATATDPLALDTRPRGGYAVYAALWCDIPALDDNLVVPTATLKLGGEAVDLPCAGKDGQPPLTRLVPLPPPVLAGPRPVAIDWAGDLPGRGSAVLATYAERGEDDAPRHARALQDTPPPVPEDATAFDSSSVKVEVDGIPAFVQRVSISRETRLSLWTAQTGLFMLLVDGIVVSDDGDTAHAYAGEGASAPDAWRDQDPELRNGSWRVDNPGRVRQFALPETLVPPAGQSREVTIQVQVEAATEASWQVQATHASSVQLVAAPVRPSSTSAPVRYGDRRLVGAWEIPVTGYPYPLITDHPLDADTVFIVVVPAGLAPPIDWTRDAALTSDLGYAALPGGWDLDEALGYMDEWLGWVGPASGPDPPPAAGDAKEVGTVKVSLMGSSSGDHGTVLAYEPTG